MAKHLTTPGSIFKPKNSKNLYIKFQGKRISTGLGDTPENRKTAGEMLRRIHLESLGVVEKRTSFSAAGTVQELFKEFKNTYGIQKSEGTHEVYDIAYKRVFGSAPEAPFAVPHLEKSLLAYLRTTTHNPWTVNNTLRTLNTWFAWALREKKLSANPIKREFYPKTPTPEVEIFTDAECRLLLDYFAATDPEYGRLLSFMLLTGFRIHECLDLKWADIRESKIYVESKDHRKMESVPISSQIKALLEAQKNSTQERPSEKDLGVYVFRWQVQSTARLRERLYAGMDKLGIERRNRSIHEFRKTFISKMANAGIDIRLAATLARCTIEVMTEHYTQLNTDIVQNAAQRIGDLTPVISEAGTHAELDPELTNS